MNIAAPPCRFSASPQEPNMTTARPCLAHCFAHDAAAARTAPALPRKSETAVSAFELRG
jgi:hypothetical protein